MKKIRKPKQTERTVKTALKYAESIIATLREPFLVLDKNLRVVSANRSFFNTFKATKKETVGRLIPSLGNRQWNIPKLIHLLKNILSNKTVVIDYQIEHDFKKIGHRIISLNARQMRIPKKIARAITGGEEEEEEELILLAIEDITERTLMKQDARKTRDYAESIVNTVREPFLVLNRDLKVVSASRSFYQIFKVVPRETEGKFIYNLGNRQWNIPKLRQLLEKILPKHAIFDNFEVEHKFPKIGKRIMLLNARRIPPPPAQPERILLAIEDITEQKKAEAVVAEKSRLEVELKQQKKTNKMRSDFISIASHQLRTPLTGAQWVVERFMKKEEKLSEKGKGYLKDIHTSFQRLSNLVDLLLNVSRIEGGEVSISPKALELVEFVDDYLDECSPLCDKKDLTVVFQKHPKTLNVVTDISALHTIVQAVVSNALEYTSKGGRVEVSLRKKERTFLLIISDNGIGIPKKEQPIIFDKFTRGTNAKLMKTDGIGFGLYFAKSTVDLLQGKIWFESEENKGSTFYIELPLKVRSKKGSKPLA